MKGKLSKLAKPGIDLLPYYAGKAEVKKFVDKRTRAAFLHREWHFTFSALSTYFGISVKMIRCALGALNKNRNVGVVGRPRVLADYGEDVLVKKIISSYEEFNSLSVSEVLTLVSIVCFFMNSYQY